MPEDSGSTLINVSHLIRNKLLTISSWCMAAILMIARPITGLLAAGVFGILNMLRNATGVGVGGIAEGVYLILSRGIGLIAAGLSIVFHLEKHAFFFMIAIVAEVLVNCLRLVAATISEMAWLFYSGIIKPHIAIALVVWNILRPGLAAMAASLFVIGSYFVQFCQLSAAALMDGLEFSMRCFAAMSVFLAHLGAPALKVIVGCLAELFNFLRQSTGIILGGVAVVLDAIRQAIGLVISSLLEVLAYLTLITFAMIEDVASLIRACIKGPVALLAEAGYVLLHLAPRIIFAPLLEFLNASRFVFGYLLGFLGGALVGLLFGGREGFKSVFNGIKDFFCAGGYQFGAWYQAVFPPMFGVEGFYKLGCIATPIWNSTSYEPGKALKSVYHDYQFGTVFNAIYHETVFGSKNNHNPIDAFYAVHHHPFFGEKGSYQFGKAFQAIWNSFTVRPVDAMRATFNYPIFGNTPYQDAQSARSTVWQKIQSFSLTDRYHSVFTPLAGTFQPKQTFLQIWESSTYRPFEMFKRFFNLSPHPDNRYLFGTTFNKINALSGHFHPLETAKRTFNHPMFGNANYRPGTIFNWFNRSRLFGDTPWMQQGVARDAFLFCNRYEIDAGFNAWITQAKEDQRFFYANAQRTVAILSGIVESLLLWPFYIVAIVVASVIGGFDRGGIVGAIAFAIRNLFTLGLTYPIRNTYRNLQLVLGEEQTGRSFNEGLFSLFREDVNEAREAQSVNWDRMFSDPYAQAAPSTVVAIPVGNVVPQESLPDNQQPLQPPAFYRGLYEFVPSQRTETEGEEMSEGYQWPSNNARGAALCPHRPVTPH